MGRHTGSFELQNTPDRNINIGGQDTTSHVLVSRDDCAWGKGIAVGVHPLGQLDN